MGAVDAPRAVRQGEEIDVAKLGAFLAVHGLVGEVTVQQFPGGHSNLTYAVTVGGTEYVLRRPPFGNRVKSAHDMGREWAMLSKLHGVFGPAPRPVVHCDDDAVIGAPFYLMERMRGVILRRALPTGLDPAAFGPEVSRRLCERFVDTLVELHAVDLQATGLASIGKPDGYIERQVTGWTKRYEDAKTDDVADMDRVAAWLAERVPAMQKVVRAAAIHNDFKLDNVVLAEDDLTKIVGVLDWEMATVGDPLMDLGTALAYWVEDGDAEEVKSFAFGPTMLPGMMTRREIAERYAAKSGRDLVDPVFFVVFAMFKNAGVAQQIYWRFKQGLTQDPRFGAFLFGVQILAREAVKLLERGTI